jgi:hypothetical protein
MKRLKKADFNEDLTEYVKRKNASTPLQSVLLKIDNKRAVDTMIKNFHGNNQAYFGKTDDVLRDITGYIASNTDENPEEVVESMFEDWEKDNVLAMPYIFVEMNNEGVDRLEGYYFDDVEQMLEDVEEYLDAPAIIDSIRN